MHPVGAVNVVIQLIQLLLEVPLLLSQTGERRLRSTAAPHFVRWAYRNVPVCKMRCTVKNIHRLMTLRKKSQHAASFKLSDVVSNIYYIWMNNPI